MARAIRRQEAGIKRAFARYGNWETKAAVKKKDDNRIPRRRRPEDKPQGVPTLPGWDELSYLGVG